MDFAIQAYGDNPAANEVAIGARITGGFQPSCGHPHDMATHLPHPLDLHERHRHFRLVGYLGVPTADASDAPQWPLPNGDRPAASGQQNRQPLSQQREAGGQALIAGTEVGGV